MSEKDCRVALLDKEGSREFIRFTSTADNPKNPLQALFKTHEVILTLEGFTSHAVEMANRRKYATEIAEMIFTIYRLMNTITSNAASVISLLTGERKVPIYSVCVRIIGEGNKVWGAFQTITLEPEKLQEESTLKQLMTSVKNFIQRKEYFEASGTLIPVGKDEEKMSEDELLEKFAKEEEVYEENLRKGAEIVRGLLKAYYALFGWVSRMAEIFPVGISTTLKSGELVTPGSITTLKFGLPVSWELLKEEYEAVKDLIPGVSWNSIQAALSVPSKSTLGARTKARQIPSSTNKKDSNQPKPSKKQKEEWEKERRRGICSGYALQYSGEGVGLGKSTVIRYI